VQVTTTSDLNSAANGGGVGGKAAALIDSTNSRPMAMKLCHLANPTKRFLCFNELETHRIVSDRAMTGATCFPNVVRLVKSWEQASVPMAWFGIAKSKNLAKQYKDMPLKEYQELIYDVKLGKPDGANGKSELAVVMEMVGLSGDGLGGGGFLINALLFYDIYGHEWE
jgi:hypothetical protein